MNQNTRRTRGSGKPARLDANMDYEEDGAPKVGLGRVFGIVLLMHIIAIGGILMFKWIEKGDQPENFAEATPEQTDGPNPYVAPAGQVRNVGKSVVLDHPTMKGHKRYRVGPNEKLPDVVRQFNASVAEVERINNLKQGGRLYAGQWLTIPDNSNSPTPATPKSKPIVPEKQIVGNLTRVEKEKLPEITPVETPTTVTPPEPKTPIEVVQNKDVLHTVGKGETAYRISLKYGVSWQEMLRANGMEDPRRLREGQVLKIPASLMSVK